MCWNFIKFTSMDEIKILDWLAWWRINNYMFYYGARDPRFANRSIFYGFFKIRLFILVRLVYEYDNKNYTITYWGGVPLLKRLFRWDKRIQRQRLVNNWRWWRRIPRQIHRRIQQYFREKTNNTNIFWRKLNFVLNSLLHL